MKILIANVTDSGIYRARREFIAHLITNGHDVTIVSPRTDASEKLMALGCSFKEVFIQRHGLNPKEELRVIYSYRKILKKEKPDIVFSFTIKPNLYLGILCRFMRIHYAMNITGLGEGLLHEGKAKKIIMFLYPIATKKAICIFFQNEFNRLFFIDNKLADPKIFRLLPGSGVNLETFTPLDYPDENKGIRFLFVSRIVKDKGIDELIKAIQIVKQRHSDVEFHFAGGCSDEYGEQVEEWKKKGLIIYHGRVAPEEILNLYKMMHCLIHPSYHEGMANVILESAACARPCLVSNINGCKEGVEEGKTGYIFEVKSVEAIIEKIESFLLLSHEQKISMGLAGRIKMENEFDRKIVVNAYMEIVRQIEK